MRAILVLKIVSIISTSSQSFNLNTLNGNSVSDRMTGLLKFFKIINSFRAFNFRDNNIISLLIIKLKLIKLN